MYKPKIISRITWRPISLFNSKRGRELLKRLYSWILPNTCYSCQRDLTWNNENPLCPICEKSLQSIGPLYCLRCGKPLPDGGAHCYDCRGSKAKHYKCKIIRSAWVFNPTLRPLIHAFKYTDRPYLAAYLAQKMDEQWKLYPDLQHTQLVMPVPLHPKKFKQRGYNQSELLARHLAKRRGLLLDTHSLLRTRNTPSQTKFGREGRLQNMSGAFTCVNPDVVKGKIILLIDDVATTGATLEGCAEALKAAGAKQVMAYTLAREV